MRIVGGSEEARENCKREIESIVSAAENRDGGKGGRGGGGAPKGAGKAHPSGGGGAAGDAAGGEGPHNHQQFGAAAAPAAMESLLIEIPENMRMVDFDNLYIVPIWGFEDAYDYYRKASARPWLPKIRVPTRILMSNDDPIVCPGVMTKDELPKDVKLKRTAFGGHLGFLAKTPDHGVQWMDRQLFAWHANLAG